MSEGTPYFDALEEYVTSQVLPFHMPGHQQGRGTPERFRRFLQQHTLAGDITQVLGMDDIQRPETVCKRAQELAARAYGADHSYFLVNGSSCGNQAMLLASLRSDEEILVPRSAHCSVMAGLVLSGARPRFYECPYDEELGVSHPPTLDCLPDPTGARALLFSSPSYYGACADLRALVEWGHGHGLVVLVDEAWGPHLKFHPDLPESALEAGADLVVQSTHKLLSGLSQASMLHLRGTRVERTRLEACLRMLQTTSANCLLVASLDVAREQMVVEGAELWGRALGLADRARAEINQVKGLRCFGARPGVHSWDRTRLVLRAEGYTGYQLEKVLRRRQNIQLEMSDFNNAVALVTPGHSEEHIDSLVAALRALPAGATRVERPPLPGWSAPLLSPRQAFEAELETVELGNSVGRISGELVAPYPPGIPLVYPGESISRQLVDYLQLELAAGATLQGAHDPNLATIRVVHGSTAF